MMNDIVEADKVAADKALDINEAVAIRDEADARGCSHSDIIEFLGCWLFDEIRDAPESAVACDLPEQHHRAER